MRSDHAGYSGFTFKTDVCGFSNGGRSDIVYALLSSGERSRA
jgi:hypothetical protein